MWLCDGGGAVTGSASPRASAHNAVLHRAASPSSSTSSWANSADGNNTHTHRGSKMRALFGSAARCVKAACAVRSRGCFCFCCCYSARVDLSRAQRQHSGLRIARERVSLFSHFLSLSHFRVQASNRASARRFFSWLLQMCVSVAPTAAARSYRHHHRCCCRCPTCTRKPARDSARVRIAI